MQLRRILPLGFAVSSALTFALITTALAQTQQSSQESASQPAPAASPQQQVPVIDGDLGPCSVEITVKRPGGKPVDGAKVTVHIAYGFLNMRRLDLEVPTNLDGKARITGLPDNLKHGLLLHGRKDDWLGTAFVDPSKTCDAKHEMVLVERAPKDEEAPASDKSDTDKSDTDKDEAGTTDSKAPPQ